MRAVTVGTTVVLLAPPGNRDFIAIYNNGTNPIFIQFDGQDEVTMTAGGGPPTAAGIGNAVTGSTLTTANGFPIAAGNWMSLNNDNLRNVMNKVILAVSTANQDVRLEGV